MLSLGGFLTLSVLGPSAVQPALGAGGGPPWALDAGLGPRAAVALLAGAIVLGGVGLGLCLSAAGRGARARSGPIVAVGALAALAFALTPPVGSSDHLNYAAYGHMAVLGLDPYATTAADLGSDAYGLAVQEWRTTPSVYGPIVTWTQAFAVWAGGGTVRGTVLVLSLISALVYVLVGLVLRRMARDEQGRLRAALLWSANPILLFQLVSGAHNDVLAIGAAVLALAVFTGGVRRTARAGETWRAFGAGALAGAAVAMKFPAGLVGAGPAWVLLRARRWGGLAALGCGALLVAGAAYAAVGFGAFNQVREASQFVSLANPWHLVAGRGGGVLGAGLDRDLVPVLSLALLALLIWLLGRALPEADDAVRAAAALVLAWLFAASYALPWYDGLGWAVLVLLPWSRFDWIMLARTVGLSLAYLPARDPVLAGLPDGLHWLVTGLRATVMPFVLAAVLAALVAACLARRPVPALVRTPPAPAGPRA
ncbi:polyprenol phosphomannose-dependent alpha 1,6 mannosyltransferase MptB [Actinocorallia aurea]